MLISHSKKFIFFHLFKTGGKSITQALTEYINIDIDPLNGKRLLEPTIQKLMKRIDPDISNCTSFENLKPYPKNIMKYIYSFLIQDFPPQSKIDRSLQFAFENPKLFRSLYQSYFNDDYPEVYSSIFIHNSARNGKEILPADIFKNYFKFAFVRHPLDWLVSMFFFLSQGKLQEGHDFFSKFKRIDEFIEFLVTHKDNLERLRFYGLDIKAPQRDFLLDDEGNLLVDYVGKFENIEEDFAKICQIIGIQVNLPHLNKSIHKHYLEYYTNETKRQAYSLLKEDFETFNYEL